MGSTSRGNPNPWTPYDSFKECAQGLCNIYCPQWCSYPPPDPGPRDDSGTNFSPLIIAVIGILASAFLLVSYYAIITKYCRRRRPRNPNIEFQGRQHHHDEEDQIWQQVGLDEALINSITVFKYKKGDRLVEGTECSVCLNEFQENENLRLLPECCHAFHPSCIDIWLKSHTNCPLCRANAVPTYNVLSVPPTPPPSSQTSSVLNTSAAPEIQSPQHDLIFVVEEEEEEEGTQRSRISNGESFFANNVSPKSPLHSNTANSVLENSETRNNSSAGAGAGLLLDEDRQIRRSISLGTFSSQRTSLLVADILKIEEEEDNNDEDFRDKVCQSDTGIGSSEGNHKSNSIRRNPELCRAPATVRRSFSTGRFYFHKTS